MRIRFYVDPETGELHVSRHGVSESDVEQVLRRPVEDRAGHDGLRVAIGPSDTGRVLRVIYVPDPEPDSVFVITALRPHGQAFDGVPAAP